MRHSHTYFVLSVALLLSSFVWGEPSCYEAPSYPQDRRVDKSVLTILTYNAEWLFLANEEDPGSCPEAGCPYDSFAEAMAHLQDVALEIQLANADVVNLVEVEGCDTLEVLLDEIGPEYGYKYYLLPGTDTYTGQNVALLTRIDPVVDLQRTSARVSYPVPGTACTGPVEGDDTGVSKHYYTKLNATGIVLNLFSMHLLAYPDDEERCYEREAQAMVIQDYIEEMVPNQNGMNPEYTVLFGDMNDFDPDLVDASDDSPISNVLNFLKSPDIYPDTLSNAGYLVPNSNNVYTSWWDKNYDCKSEEGELSAIDHILVDPYLWKNATYTSYIHNYSATCATAFSDHWPVLLRVQF